MRHVDLLTLSFLGTKSYLFFCISSALWYQSIRQGDPNWTAGYSAEYTEGL